MIPDSRIVLASAEAEHGLAKAPAPTLGDETPSVDEEVKISALLVRSDLTNARLEGFVIVSLPVAIQRQFDVVQVRLAIASRPP